MAKKATEFEQQILQFLRQNKGLSLKQRKLANKLGVPASKYPLFKQILRRMAEEGNIERGSHNNYRIPDPSRNVTGLISFTSKGFAFLGTPSGEEIFIGSYDTGTALNHDTVLVERYKKQSGKLPEGKVLKVLKRSDEPIFGTLKKEMGRWFALPESPSPPIKIEIVGDTEKLRNEQLIELGNLQWDQAQLPPQAEVKQILGILEEPRDDLMIIKKMFRLPDSFPRRVIEETEQLGEPDFRDTTGYRLDLRDKEVFTIDPEEARDFDDAVSLETAENGRWLLGVHIADVSHFVSAASQIDREARQRGTSVYFTEAVVPMLPERLSNELCSLKPNQDRFTFSVLMTLTAEGEVEEYRITPSMIRSRYRFSYKEAQKILDDGEGVHYETLQRLNSLSKKLSERRKQAGSIDFDLPEAIFTLQANGIPSDVRASERLETNRLIEEFMLLANRTVAEWIALKRRKEQLPFIYRVHEPPKEEAVNGLYDILGRLGMSHKRPRHFTPRDMSKILLSIQHLPYKNFIEKISLRSMSKAIYSQLPLGHFGLAFRHYTHFTSPIRRYPDLLVHRLLKLYLREVSEEDKKFYRRSVPRTAKLSSENEIHAVEAEREYAKIKQIRFLADKVGKWYKGIITGVLEFGFFVEISDFMIEGLVHVRTLNDDYYIFDEKNHTLRGKKNERKFQLGDPVNVMVAKVSVKDRRIDFLWGE